MSVTLLLTTIAAQVGSAYFNSKRSKTQSAELAEQQQRLEEKIMLQGIENSREEYAQVCALQREIEQLMQKDRLELIQQNYITSIELDAYNVSLEHWPLFTPPYVIKGQVIDGLNGVNSNDAIPLNCIMTTSMHPKFNQKIFPQLEERLALFCSKHWNSSQPNSIRFYQNAWRDNIVDLGSRIIDLYAHLDDVPTIVLSPVVRDGKITFRIYWWGISENPIDQHTNEPMVYDPELSITITDELSLSEVQINSIVDELANKLAAIVSFFADQYYWNFYKYPINLPKLIATNALNIQYEIKKEIISALIKVLDNNAESKDTISRLVYVKSLQQVSSEFDIHEVINREVKNIRKCKLLQVDALNELLDINKSKDVIQLIDKYTEEFIEEIEIIDDAILNFEYLHNFVNLNMSKAFNCFSFSYVEWSPNIVIGCFCNQDYEPCIFNISNTSRFFVFITSEAPLNEKPYPTFEINVIPINNNILKDFNMAKNDGFRQRLGRRLINVGQKLIEESTTNNHGKNSPWDNTSSNSVDELQFISNFFISGVDNGSIQYTKSGDNLSMRDVLDWLDNLSDEAVGNNNQVYVVKANYAAKKVLLYCVFLAKDDRFNLNLPHKHCFICNTESEEMQNLFAGKKVYIIPFEN